jgi:hypothetical protein
MRLVRLERLGVFEVGGVEALGEPVVDVSGYRARLSSLLASRAIAPRLVVARSSDILAFRLERSRSRGAESFRLHQVSLRQERHARDSMKLRRELALARFFASTQRIKHDLQRPKNLFSSIARNCPTCADGEHPVT